jgi:thiamine-phosphate pyrophosphorylase
MRLAIPRLYAIIDPAHSHGRSAEEVCDALLGAGVRLIQYRDKHSASRAIFEKSLQLVARVHEAGGRFIVNDRADIARAVEADGVHVGKEDLPVELARCVVGPERWVGFSAHNLAQVREADSSTADYVAIGPAFATASKENPDPVVGLEGIRAARQATGKPLVAIGGITAESSRSVIEAGADAVAVIQDLISSPDITARAKEFLKALGEVASESDDNGARA